MRKLAVLCAGALTLLGGTRADAGGHWSVGIGIGLPVYRPYYGGYYGPYYGGPYYGPRCYWRRVWTDWGPQRQRVCY